MSSTSIAECVVDNTSCSVVSDNGSILDDFKMVSLLFTVGVLFFTEDGLVTIEHVSRRDPFLWNEQHADNIYRYEGQQQGENASVYTSLLMYRAVQLEDIDFIDYFIQSLNKVLLTRWSLIALLRSTCGYKQAISSWKDLYFYTKKYLEENGFNSKRLLVGLERGLDLG